MECKKCKNIINENDKFCFNCGRSIKIRDLNAFINGKTIAILISLFCLFGIFILGYSFTKKINSPDTVAMKYFETVIKNDSAKIYSYIEEYSDSPFVSEKILSDKMTRLGKIENYSIKGIKENGNSLLVEFEYDLDGEYQTSYVELKKEKIFKYFDSYKVVSGKLALNVTIRVLSGASVTIDGKEISNYLDENDDDKYYDTYVIPAMIAGSYKFDITLKNGLEMDKEISLASNSKYTLSKVNLSDDLTNSIESNLKDALNLLYKSAVDGKDYDEINEFKNDLSSLYRSVKRSMNSSSKSVEEIEFTNVELKSSMFNEKGKLEVEIFAIRYIIIYISHIIISKYFYF